MHPNPETEATQAATEPVGGMLAGTAFKPVEQGEPAEDPHAHQRALAAALRIRPTTTIEEGS